MSVKDWTNLKLIDTLIVETLAISTGQGANRVALEVHDEILLRLNQAQPPCSECATLRKERDDVNGRIDEAWGKVNSLDRQKAHLLEVYARISKEKEDAEAQLSTLEKWFMDHWNEIDRAGIYDRDLIRAALAPTPEIAPKK